MTSGRFEGRSAFVTGGGSGIGFAVVSRLLAEGASVLVYDQNLDEVRHGLAQGGLPASRLIAVEGDVCNRNSLERAVKLLADKHGSVDMLFSNAGITGPTGPFWLHDPDAFDRVIAINLTGVWNSLAAVVPMMIEAGRGSIVNTASVGGVGSCSGLMGYGAAKAAVVNMTKTAAVELGGTGVRVNAICPGSIDTPMLRKLEELRGPGDPDTGRKRILRSVPMRRYSQPEEVAALVTFLLSDEASYMTGSIVAVDGGLLAH